VNVEEIKAKRNLPKSIVFLVVAKSGIVLDQYCQQPFFRVISQTSEAAPLTVFRSHNNRG